MYTWSTGPNWQVSQTLIATTLIYLLVMTFDPGDVAAVWEVRLADGLHTVQFEHGTTSGKRVITVDGVEVQYTCMSDSDS